MRKGDKPVPWKVIPDPDKPEIRHPSKSGKFIAVVSLLVVVDQHGDRYQLPGSYVQELATLDIAKPKSDDNRWATGKNDTDGGEGALRGGPWEPGGFADPISGGPNTGGADAPRNKHQHFRIRVPGDGTSKPVIIYPIDRRPHLIIYDPVEGPKRILPN